MTTNPAPLPRSQSTLMDRLTRWFPVDRYTDPLSRFRAYCSYGLSLLVVAIMVFVISATLLVLNNQPNTSITIGSLWPQILVILCGFLAVALVRTGRQRLSVYLTFFAIQLTEVAFFLFTPPVIDSLFIFTFVGIFLLMASTSVVFTSRDLPVILIFSLIEVLVSIGRYNMLAPHNGLAFAIVAITTLVAMSVVVGLLMRVQEVASGQMGLVLSREQRFSRSGQAVAQAMARTLEPATFLAEAGRIVLGTVPEISQVQIWQLEIGERRGGSTFSLGFTTGRLETDSLPGANFLSQLTQVTDSGKPIHLQGGAGMLDGMADQMLFPIRTADRLLGVLVIASVQPNVFQGSELGDSQSIADQIGLALDNVRLRVEQRLMYAERQRLNDELRARQDQLEQKNQQDNLLGWNNYLAAREADRPAAFTLDLQSGQIDSFADWTPNLERAARTGQAADTLIDPGQDGHLIQTVALPLTVQGSTIGALEFELASGQTATPEQIAILQQVVQEMALAVENARLIEDSQRAARRDALASAISARLQNVISVEAVMTSAAQSLAEVLHAPRIAIRLNESSLESTLDYSTNSNGRTDRPQVTP